MRKHVAQAACVVLPLATAFVANIVTPGYALVGHTTTMVVSLIVGFTALFVITLNMRDDRSSPSGWQIAAGWVITTAILLSVLLETVILKPGGVDGRQWLPTMVIAAISIIALCERDGDRSNPIILLRSAALAAMAIGGVVMMSIAVSAAAGRLSGKDAMTIMLMIAFAPFVLAAMLQTQRGGNRSRARLGVFSLLCIMMIVVTSEGTYTWTPHYSPDAVGMQLFQ